MACNHSIDAWERDAFCVNWWAIVPYLWTWGCSIASALFLRGGIQKASISFGGVFTFIRWLATGLTRLSQTWYLCPNRFDQAWVGLFKLRFIGWDYQVVKLPQHVLSFRQTLSNLVVHLRYSWLFICHPVPCFWSLREHCFWFRYSSNSFASVCPSAWLHCWEHDSTVEMDAHDLLSLVCVWI